MLLEGGERRPSEDSGWYPDARKQGFHGKTVEPYQEPPPEEGDAGQVVDSLVVPVQEVRHDLDAEVLRRTRTLHTPTGLTRQAVRLVELAAGGRSTVLHTHDRTDEWVFIRAGRAVAQVGDATFEVGPDDFLGYPAGGPGAPADGARAADLPRRRPDRRDRRRHLSFATEAARRWTPRAAVRRESR